MDRFSSIGVFDSGVGGLSILKEIRQSLVNENLIYFADSQHVPYGGKSSSFLKERAHGITEFLIKQDAKAIVVACNTATAAAVASLRESFDVPIIGLEPALKPAVTRTKTGVVGVLATPSTLASFKFARLLEKFGGDVEVIVQACPKLPELVEAGDLDGEEVRGWLEHYCLPLKNANVDVIVLGCTHYPFLKSQIQDVVGSNIMLLDSGVAVAKQVKRVLNEQDLLSISSAQGTEQFWTNGSTKLVEETMSVLWQRPIQLVECAI